MADQIPLQQTFDTVVEHLRKQGTKAVNGWMCQYRTDEGLKCAVGCLIPYENYLPEFEGTDIQDKTTAIRLLVDSLGHDIDLLSALQNTHDSVAVPRWESSFENIAEDHELTYAPPMEQA